jgi:mannose-6-phosphate isomerase-like protein (cupin superfamily)
MFILLYHARAGSIGDYLLNKTSGDIDVQVEEKYKCLKAIMYVSLAQLQPTLSYEKHQHQDHEELYYIINGKGKIKIGTEESQFGGFIDMNSK